MNSPLADYIRQFCRQKKLSLETLAGNAGIARGTLYHLLSQDSQPKITHLVKLAHAMQVHHRVLLDLAWQQLMVIDHTTGTPIPIPPTPHARWR